MNEGIVDIKLDFDASDAKHTISELGNKVKKAFVAAGGADPLEVLEKDIDKIVDNIDEIKKKIKEVKKEKILNPDAAKEIEEYKSKLEELEYNYPKINPELELSDEQLAKLSALEEEYNRISNLYDKHLEMDVPDDEIDAWNQKSIELQDQLHNISTEISYIENHGELEVFSDEDLQTLDAYNKEIEALEQKIKDMSSDKNNLIPADTASRVAELTVQLEDQKTTLDALKKKKEELEDAEDKETNAVKRSTAAHKEHNTILGTSLTRLVGYAIGIRSLYSVFYKLRSAAKEGLGYVANASYGVRNAVNSISASFLQMKAATGAAIAPLVQALAPVISRIAILFTQAANAVARFFAVITGKKTVTQAVVNQKAYSAAVGKSGGATKKAAKDIKDASKDIDKSLAPFDDLQVLTQDAADNLADTADDMGDLGGVGGGIGDGLSEAFETINLDDFNSEFLDKIKEWIDNLNLEPLKEAWDKFTDALDRFFTICKEAGLWVLENVLLPLGTWLIESALPLILENIALAIEVICDILEELGILLQPLWENILKPLFEWIGDIVITALTWVKDKLEELHKWFQDNKGTPEAQALALGIILLVGLVIAILLSLINHFKDTKTAADDSKVGIDNIKGSFDKFLESLGRAAVIASVALLLEGLSHVIESLTGLIETMNATNTSAWDIFVLLLAILTPLTVAVGALLILVAALGPELLIGAFALDLIAIAIGVVALAIEGVLAAIGELVDKYVTKLIEFLDKSKQNIQDIKKEGPLAVAEMIKVINKYKDMAKTVHDKSADMKKDVSDMATGEGGIKPTLSTLMTDIETDFATFVTNMNTKFSNFVKNEIETTLMKGIKDTVEKYLNDTEGLMKLLNDFQEKFEKDFLEKIKTNVEDYITGEKEGSVKKLLDSFKEWFNNDFIHLGLEHALGNFKETLRKTINDGLKFFETLANGVATAAEAIADSINQLEVEIPDWVPGYGGKSWHPDLNVSGHTVSLPRLATGAVLPPNQPFLAMLGDQKSGVNIEAPLDTIVQAMEEALMNMNYGGAGGQEIVLNIDGTTLARMTVPYQLNELNRKGYNVKLLEGK